MEIVQKAVSIKLDKEEREHLVATIDLFDRMEGSAPCGEDCPFKTKCDEESSSKCLLRTIKKHLIYINNHCD